MGWASVARHGHAPPATTGGANHAARRKPSSCRIQAAAWFQLANVRVISLSEQFFPFCQRCGLVERLRLRPGCSCLRWLVIQTIYRGAVRPGNEMVIGVDGDLNARVSVAFEFSRVRVHGSNSAEIANGQPRASDGRAERSAAFQGDYGAAGAGSPFANVAPIT